MILYFAANVAGYDHIMYDTGVREKLLTFAEIDDWGKLSFDYWVHNRPPGVNIFLDCGAFSAFMRRAVIDIDRYMAYIDKNRSNIESYVQLDVIGDPAATRRNLKIMEAGGFTPLPVFTGAATTKDLEELLEMGYRHICLGGLRSKEPGTVAWRMKHFDKVFATARKYWPVKFHAFGISAQWIMERYPLYSCDSSAAIVGAGLGRILEMRDGIFDVDIWQNYARRTYDGNVVDGIGETGNSGRTISAHIGRRKTNIRTMLQLERYVNNLWRLKGHSWETENRNVATALS